MFARKERLTRKRDVEKVYRSQLTAGTQFLYIRALPNRLPYSRYTVVIGKKIARRAVVRNRLKRLVRTAIYELNQEQKLPQRTTGLDVLVTVHRDPEPPYELARLKQEVERCFARLPSS